MHPDVNQIKDGYRRHRAGRQAERMVPGRGKIGYDNSK